MRELKFRAWDKTQKKMLHRVLAGPGEPCSIVYDEERRDWVQFDEACGEIMQFTGLRDKHDKEIFEGDIVKFSNHFTGQELLRQCKWDTKYPSFVFCRLDQHSNEDIGGWKFLQYLESTHGTMEVIGNIYETPSLTID